MNLDPRLIVALALGATVVLWIVALVLGRVDMRVTIRGLRNGALIALALFALITVIVAFVFNGRAVFVTTLDLTGAIELGVLVGLVVGLGYLWAGSVLIAIGLIFKSKPQWTTLGAWAAVPVIIAGLGFGYVSYRSVQADSAGTSTANGSMSISLTGPSNTRISADGAATCTSNASGSGVISAGTQSDPRIVTTDGRLVQATLSYDAAANAATLDTLVITGLDLETTTTSTATNSSAAAGQIQVGGSNWSGTISWSCNR